MKLVKVTAISIIIAASALALTGCDKDDPHPVLGSIRGTVTPADATPVVWAILGADSTKGVVAADGTFKIENLKPSESWKIGYDATVEGYDDFVLEPVSVVGAEVTQLDPVVLEESAAE